MKLHLKISESLKKAEKRQRLQMLVQIFLNEILHSKKEKPKPFFKNEIKKFVNNTDLYLHYSNSVIFYMERAGEAEGLVIISFQTQSTGEISLVILILSSKRQSFFIIHKEDANVFDGVIERYCGVPP